MYNSKISEIYNRQTYKRKTVLDIPNEQNQYIKV